MAYFHYSSNVNEEITAICWNYTVLIYEAKTKTNHKQFRPLTLKLNILWTETTTSNKGEHNCYPTLHIWTKNNISVTQIAPNLIYFFTDLYSSLHRWNSAALSLFLLKHCCFITFLLFAASQRTTNQRSIYLHRARTYWKKLRAQKQKGSLKEIESIYNATIAINFSTLKPYFLSEPLHG